MDYRSIAKFAIDNPDSWEMLSKGYPSEILEQINQEVQVIQEFDNDLRALVDDFLTLHPMVEREYKSTKRNESRILVPMGSYQIELRVWEKLSSNADPDDD